MRWKLRSGEVVERKDSQERLLSLLYGTIGGRVFLKILTRPLVSKAAGAFLSTKLSCFLIRPFVRRNGIDMSQFTEEKYGSYNAFFSRKIRSGARKVDMDARHLISPCDSKLTAVPIGEDLQLTIKHTTYTIESLLRDSQLAKEFCGGWALIFRLTVDDYHRYCYVADARKSANVSLPGVLHTVNPIANDYFPIYKENAREYTLCDTREFGKLLMMEVGALLVGRIVNHHQEAEVKRGEEKGYFQFGGSTIVMLLQEGRVHVDADILKNSKAGLETVVRMGEKIGTI